MAIFRHIAVDDLEAGGPALEPCSLAQHVGCPEIAYAIQAGARHVSQTSVSYGGLRIALRLKGQRRR